MSTRIQNRRDTASNWASINPVLGSGEIGYEIGTPARFKIGDGATAWNSLPYHSDDAVQAALFANKANIYAALAKTPDTLVTGAINLDSNNLVTSAAVLWPDGTPGTFTVTSRDSNNAILAYTVTYGSPATKTYTQPTITRNAAGAATNVPQIVVS